MVVVATILCDRKASSQLVAIPRTAALQGDIRLYVNIESDCSSSEFDTLYAPLLNFLRNECKVPWDLDVWSVKSTWIPKPKYDQDQARLRGIIMGRNMCIEYAQSKEASHLLFIDADVLPEADGLQKLLETGKPFVGGLVPGRGSHKHAQYLFYQTGKTEMGGKLIECGFGTCGYMLISNEIFPYFRFRWGPDFKARHVPLSEDPAFCNDLVHHTGIKFWIRSDVRAGHWDDPKAPLTEGQACRHQSMAV